MENLKIDAGYSSLSIGGAEKQADSDFILMQKARVHVRARVDVRRIGVAAFLLFSRVWLRGDTGLASVMTSGY